MSEASLRTLSRYLIREFFKLFCVCQTLFIVIYLIVEFLQKLDNFIRGNVDAGVMAAYMLYKTPFIAVQMTPVAGLISVIVLLSVMKKHNEITAVKGSGISIVRLSLPLIFCGMILSAGVFLVSEFVVPHTVAESEAIYTQDVKKQSQKRFYGRADIWYKGVDSIYWIRHFDPKSLTMGNPSFFFMDGRFRMMLKIRSRWAVWTGTHWKAVQGVAQIANGDGTFDSRAFDEMDLNIPERPESFLKTVKKPEEMSYWELKQYAREIQREGYSATDYLVDMNIKLAFPLVSCILILIGIPIALGVRRGGAPFAVSLGIGACFVYLVVLGIARSFGLSGALPPVLSAWFGNAVFFLAGVYVLMHADS